MPTTPPPKPQRTIQARHIASWDARDFQELLTLALDVLTQDKGTLVDLQYSTSAALSTVAGTKVHYSAVLLYKQPEATAPGP